MPIQTAGSGLRKCSSYGPLGASSAQADVSYDHDQETSDQPVTSQIGATGLTQISVDDVRPEMPHLLRHQVLGIIVDIAKILQLDDPLLRIAVAETMSAG